MLKINRKKQPLRWFDELPRIIEFLERQEKDAVVSFLFVWGTPSISELIRMAAEEPGGDDAAIEVLGGMGEQGRQKLLKKLKDNRMKSRYGVIVHLLMLIFPSDDTSNQIRERANRMQDREAAEELRQFLTLHTHIQAKLENGV